MANTVQTNIQFSISKDSFRLSDSLSLSETTSGTDAIAQPYTVTTSWVAIPLGALASFKKLMIRNTDAANFIQVAIDGSGTNKILKIVAGDANLFTPDPTQTLYWKADTASVLCTITATEP